MINLVLTPESSFGYYGHSAQNVALRAAGG
jgi:hypothetical protein